VANFSKERGYSYKFDWHQGSEIFTNDSQPLLNDGSIKNNWQHKIFGVHY